MNLTYLNAWEVGRRKGYRGTDPEWLAPFYTA